MRGNRVGKSFAKYRSVGRGGLERGVRRKNRVLGGRIRRKEEKSVGEKAMFHIYNKVSKGDYR